MDTEKTTTKKTPKPKTTAKRSTAKRTPPKRARKPTTAPKRAHHKKKAAADAPAFRLQIRAEGGTVVEIGQALTIAGARINGTDSSGGTFHVGGCKVDYTFAPAT